MEETMSKIHVWIGTFKGNDSDFNKYFEVDQANVKTNKGGSQFDKDTGLNWFDSDHIGVFFNHEITSLESVVNEVIGSSDMLQAIYNKCIEKGITEANAMIYYFSDDLEYVSSSELSNGLSYIGLYTL